MINTAYVNEELIEQIKELLEQEGIVQLNEFLDEKVLNDVKKKREQRKLKRVYNPLSASYSWIDWAENVEDITAFIEKIVGRVKVRSVKLICFKHKDYTLINDKQSEEEGYTIIVELTDGWNKESGGFTSFIKNNEEMQRIYPIPNSLSLIKTNKELKSFVKYINHKAGNEKRIFLEIKCKK